MVFRLKEVLEGPSHQLCPLPAPSIHFLPTLAAYSDYNGKRKRADPRGSRQPAWDHICTSTHTHSAYRIFWVLIEFLLPCVLESSVTDWCGAWVTIEANRKQMVLNSEMGNVTVDLPSLSLSKMPLDAIWVTKTNQSNEISDGMLSDKNVNRACQSSYRTCSISDKWNGICNCP